MNIAIIPARSGSKGLKDKNIKLLNGKPLIAYSIDAAIKSQIFDEVHVSTDSKKYACIAKEYGASVPFLRNPVLATGTALSWDVVCSVLEEYKKQDKVFDVVVLLQPTSPLRTPEDIVGAYRLFCQNNASAVVSVCQTEHSPLWCGKLPEDLSMNGFIPDDILNLPRQMLESYYRINGAVYIVRTSYLSRNVNLYSENCYAYIMPKERSVDIDSDLDFLTAQTILESRAGNYSINR